MPENLVVTGLRILKDDQNIGRLQMRMQEIDYDMSDASILFSVYEWVDVPIYEAGLWPEDA